MAIEEKYVIVGGGLSGLALAYELSKKGISTTILEGSSRLGGRIQTVKGENQTPLELGATWLGDLHTNLLDLIDELGLKKYPQYSEGISLFETKSFEPPQKFFVPESEAPSYRITGGTQILTDTLAEKLSGNQIHLNTKVQAIKLTKTGLELQTGDDIIHADKVFLCLPPELASGIAFSPGLPEDLKALLPSVQTWMAGSLKFAVEYDEPFWRNEGYSGMLFSHAGIVTEMYDHTNYEKSKFGFTGFLNPGTAAYSQEVRKENVLKHLKKLLGEKATSIVSYHDKVWTDEFVISGSQELQRPHQNNGHPLLQHDYMEGRLFFSNTETAREYAGYMEGAVGSSREMIKRLGF
ncbi:MAG: NAD(P)/FAD-dependent oxidoreductase [Christiangramia sp.]|nr:NAD(P)/FAD-dependent oxidoreductase [Christiangramia sp.]